MLPQDGGGYFCRGTQPDCPRAMLVSSIPTGEFEQALIKRTKWWFSMDLGWERVGLHLRSLRQSLLRNRSPVPRTAGKSCCRGPIAVSTSVLPRPLQRAKTFSAGPFSPELCTFGQRYGLRKTIDTGIFAYNSASWSSKGIRLGDANRRRQPREREPGAGWSMSQGSQSQAVAPSSTPQRRR
jgi:hypothetical protein